MELSIQFHFSAFIVLYSYEIFTKYYCSVIAFIVLYSYEIFTKYYCSVIVFKCSVVFCTVFIIIIFVLRSKWSCLFFACGTYFDKFVFIYVSDKNIPTDFECLLPFSTYIWSQNGTTTHNFDIIF